MSDLGLRPFLLKQPDGDEVERSIELLDKVLSEFEDPESLPHIEPDSPSQGHQSEDDGYMSMNGKKMSALSVAQDDSNNAKKKIRNEILNGINSIEGEIIPLQTTLPKMRPSNANPSNYASLPCSNQPRIGHSNSVDEQYLMGSARTVLGIGISAVHDAVLRGVARIPDTIINEHPVTIYPGRTSPAKRVPPRTLPGLIDRHRDVCRQNLDSLHDGINDSNESIDITVDDENSKITIVNRPAVSKIIFNSSVHIEPCGARKGVKRNDDDEFSDDSLEGTSNNESNSLPEPPSLHLHEPLVLEQPFVPPPPLSSQSAPVTPNKRSSIAWEININEEDTDLEKPLKIPSNIFGTSNVAGSQTSVASTPCNSVTSTEYTCSSDWPDPPEQPICSTEDEAGSLYTDSEDVNIPANKQKPIQNGTYVIRKGRTRPPLFDLEAYAATVLPATDTEPESLNIEEEEAEIEIEHIEKVEEHLISSPQRTKPTNNYRHSIDLPLNTSAQHSSINSPRARLSLNLPSTEVNDLWSTGKQSQSPLQHEYKMFCSKLDGLPLRTSNGSLGKTNNTTATTTTTTTSNKGSIENIENENVTQTKHSPASAISSLSSNNPITNDELNLSSTRVVSIPSNNAPINNVDVLSTPRRELAPPIEEDEEQDSESQRGAPLRQIENNISALLRGDIPIVSRVDIAPVRRPSGFRAGVHKSESAKEMLLSQNMFGPLPPSPPTSSPDETDGFPPLPPSPPSPLDSDKFDEINLPDTHGFRTPSLSRTNRYRDTIDHAPAVPPHRCTPTLNTLKTRSMDAGFAKSYKSHTPSMSPHTQSTLPQDLNGSSSSRRRIMSGAFPKRSAQSPREERRLQTSCSLPETPIFARGCDVPRTPHRRTQEMPACAGSRTAPRPMNGLNSSIVGIAGSALNGRHPQSRCINQALASSEMLRMAGGPGRGWYPKQRQSRPASTENLDHITTHGSFRAWDTGSASRKPLTLPPNLSPNFFNKSPREALRRVTSLLIRKGVNTKDTNKKEKDTVPQTHRSFDAGTTQSTNSHKKKGFFKSFWKKSKHYSLEQ